MRDGTTNDAGHPGSPYIAAEEGDSYRILPGAADSGVVILCDHAGNAFPEDYGTLGLPASELERHIAYDIGCAEVTRLMSAALGVPAVMTRYSRLLIDCNRGLDDPTLIMRLSDGAIIPGNRHLDAAERDKRVALYYEPYHQAIDRVIDRCIDCERPPLLLSMHSFTHTWKGVPRPWHVGILWDRDDRVAAPLLGSLRKDPALSVGDNQPYSGQLAGDCMWQHGTRRGLAHALVELRQDLIGEAAGQREWADRLASTVRELLGDKTFRDAAGAVRFFGSRSDDGDARDDVQEPRAPALAAARSA
jgi:predicted N-formylglutamate amidohydrolase